MLHAGLPEATVYHGRHTSCSTLAYQRPQSITVATPHAPRWLTRGHSLSRSPHLMLHAGLSEATVYHGRHTSCSTLAYQRPQSITVATPHAPRWLTRGHSLPRSPHLMLHAGLPEATVYHGRHTSCSTLAYQRPQSITVATPRAPRWLTWGHSLSRSPHLVLHAGLPEATVYHGRHTSCSTLAYQRPQSITVATPYAPLWLTRGHSLSRSSHLVLHAGLPEATVYHGRHTSCSTLAYLRPQSVTVATPRAPRWLTWGHSLSQSLHLMLHAGLPEATVYHGRHTSVNSLSRVVVLVDLPFLCPFAFRAH